ncbi:MAG TPA: YfcE family phosphodiesterase [Patescibacteria group bacterium]
MKRKMPAGGRKVAVISDIHNNEVNLKKVLDYCAREKIQTIICCGDLASKETLDFLNDNFLGTIYYVFGNMDNEQLRDVSGEDKYKKTIVSKNFGEAEIDGKKIAFIHFPEEAKKLCQSGKYNLVFYGHTHKPWTEKIENCVLLNPGNVAGEIYPPTFAVWETDRNKFSLIRVHTLK